MNQNNRSIQRIFLIIIIFSFFCNLVSAQKMREIIIDRDTVQEFNKNPSINEETFVEDGIRMYTVDSLKRVISIATYKGNVQDGYYYGFFIDLNMLEEKGEYKTGKKHGTWYFWNRKGVLIRTEVWKNDKLISKKLLIKK